MGIITIIHSGHHHHFGGWGHGGHWGGGYHGGYHDTDVNIVNNYNNTTVNNEDGGVGGGGEGGGQPADPAVEGAGGECPQFDYFYEWEKLHKISDKLDYQIDLPKIRNFPGRRTTFWLT